METFKIGDLVTTRRDSKVASQIIDVVIEETGRMLYQVDTKDYFYADNLYPAFSPKDRFLPDAPCNLKTVIVTGGAGYVGSILTRNLIKNNYRVICIDKLQFGGSSLLDICGNPNLTLKNVDINNYNEIDTIIEESNCYAIVHLASIVGDPACRLDPELARRTNLDSSIHLIKKAIENNIERFIFASTCSNYGKMKDSDGYVDENSMLSPVSLYAELKVQVENFILSEVTKSDSFAPTCLRFATVYGISPRMRFDLTINEFTKELALGRELMVFGEQFWRPYCHVSDFSRAILTVLREHKSKVAYNVFNVGDSNENYTKKMIVNEILKVIPSGIVKYIRKEEDPRDYRVRFDKIQNDLGFVISKTVPEGIEEVFRSVKSGVVDDPDDQRFYNIPI